MLYEPLSSGLCSNSFSEKPAKLLPPSVSPPPTLLLSEIVRLYHKVSYTSNLLTKAFTKRCLSGMSILVTVSEGDSIYQVCQKELIKATPESGFLPRHVRGKLHVAMSLTKTAD